MSVYGTPETCTHAAACRVGVTRADSRAGRRAAPEWFVRLNEALCTAATNGPAYGVFSASERVPRGTPMFVAS